MVDLHYSLTIKEIFEKFKAGNFFYGRFNDGEIRSVSMKKGHNCDKHQYFPEMGKDLKDVLLRYDYITMFKNYIISSPGTFYKNAPWFTQTIDDIKVNNPGLSMYANNGLNYNLIGNSERLEEFLNFIHTKHIVLVGPEYLKELKIIKRFDHIQIPLVDCYLNKDNIIKNMSNYINDNSDKEIYFLISASMLSEVLVDYFYGKDSKNSFIDWGSAWDSFFQSEKYSFIKRRGGTGSLEFWNKKYNNIKNFIV